MNPDIAASPVRLLAFDESSRATTSSLSIDPHLSKLAGQIDSDLPNGAGVLLLTDLLALGNSRYRAVIEGLAAAFQRRGQRVLMGGSPWLQGEPVGVHWDITRLRGVARNRGWRLVDFEREALGRFCVGSRTYFLPRLMAEVSAIINAACAYRHRQWRMTGALFGLLNAIPGWKQSVLSRLQYHGSGLDEIVADLAALLSPAFHLLCLDSPLEPAARAETSPGYVLTSTDPVALDSAAAALTGLKCDRLTFLRAAAGSGLGLLNFRLSGTRPGAGSFSWKELPPFSADRLTPLPASVERLLWHYWGDRVQIDAAPCVRCDGCNLRAAQFTTPPADEGAARIDFQHGVFQDVSSAGGCEAGVRHRRLRPLRTLWKLTGRKSCDI